MTALCIWIAAPLAVLSAVPVLHSLVRLALFFASRREVPRTSGRTPRCLTVVPSRGEKTAVTATLESAIATGDVVLLLDGADEAAEAVASAIGATVIRKEPAGPTKAAALAWLVQHEADRLRGYDAIMILDVGSRLPPDLMRHIAWPDGVAAIQCEIRGKGIGAGDAAAASEQFAQRVEDRGRMRHGWNARLRGTGMLIAPSALIEVAPLLRTRIEDCEMSLLLASSGRRIILAPPDAFIFDDKPGDVRSAAAQRARWLAGQLSLLAIHPRAIARLAGRAPMEGAAFAIELLGKPLLLTAPLRIAASCALFLCCSGDAARILAAIIATSVAIDALTFAFAGGRAAGRSIAALTVSWIRAVFLLPRAVADWMRVEKR